MLVRILITRAKIQEETKTGGIAAECLASLVQRRHFYDFLEHLVAGDKRTYEEHMSLKGELTCFEALTTCKYPTGKDDACVMIGECRDYGLYAFNKVNSYFILIRNTMCKRELSNEDKTLLKQHIIYYYRLFLAYNLCNPLKVNHDNLVSFNRGDICCLRNEIYPDNTNGKDKPNDFYFPPVNVPFMKVMDASAPEGKDSDKDSAKGADSIKDKIKKLDFDKVHGYERETSEEVNTSKIHYVLANIDKPVHIIGNRKLSEILNNRIIKPLKSDKKTLEKYGINCVPNFILYGEPGCGKTEAVSQFCMHLGLEPVVINSATIGATSIHETPGKIHEKFKEAFEKKNGVVIIDEADVFLNDRASLREDLDYKFEEIGAFLQCFDKAVKNHTLIISMTNYLDRIDKAIIREGRLGIHIEVTKPDEMDLEEIIEHCFEKSELEKLDKAQMVKALNGKTLASVFSIFNGIRMDVVMNDAELSQQYVMQKINTALGYTLKPGAHFSLPGQQKFEDYVNKKIVHHLLNPDVYRNFKIKFPNSMLLYGPTGTGKTYAAKELAKFLGWNFVKLDSKSIGSEYVQGSAIKIARVFDRARREAPCILFIDEIDAWLPKRSERSSRSDISQVNEFLSNMSQLNADNLLLIGTTNRLDDIDEAALRYGRFSTKIEIGYMKGAQVENLLNSLIEDIPYDDTINLSEIAKSLDNKSVADIVAFFEKACRFGAENKYSLLTEECFSKAMNNELKQDKCHRIGFL
jgi:SpoVK/Ycf46/Vps4 family AAA+-type ATPase